MLLADVEYETVQFIAIAREVHVVAVVYRFVFELAEVVFEVVEAVLAHTFNMLAQGIEIGKPVDRRRAY